MSYLEVVDRVSRAAERTGRHPEEITLVAVSKTMTPAMIMTVYEQGHRDFGENRAQEMAEKAARLPDDIRWHFVGGLQTNKARLVRARTHLLHSLDRDSLIQAWVKGPGMPPPALVQVDIGDEPQKQGVAPDAVEALIETAADRGVEVPGLMAIPPLPGTPEDSRPYFAEMRRLRDELATDHPGVRQLSMGMTDDFEVAIDEGATIIRVGRAIFGARS